MTRPYTRSLFLKLLLPVALLALGTSTRIAGQQPVDTHKADASAEQPKTATVGVAGMQVAIDPATGKLRPLTGEEKKALALALGKLANRSVDGLVAVDRPGGAKSIDLRGRFMSVAVASVGANGVAEASCLTDPETATILASGDSKPVTPHKHQTPQPAQER